MNSRPQPDRDLNAFELALRYGEQRENEFARMLFRPDIEVKSDKKAASSHHIFVEIAQGMPRRDSGIVTSKAALWAIDLVGLGWFVITRERLLALARLAWREKGETPGGDNHNVGVLVPVEWLVKPFRGV